MSQQNQTILLPTHKMNSSVNKSLKPINSDLFRAFSCFRKLQYLIGSSRIKVKDGFIGPPTIYQKTYTFIIIIGVTLLYVALDAFYLSYYKDRDHILYLCGVIAIILHYSAYALNLVHVRFCNNDDYIDFCVRLQELDDIMKISRVRLNSVLRRVCKMNVIILVGVFFSISLSSLLDGSIPVVLTAYTTTFSETSFMLDLFLCSNIMAYFAIRMRVLNSILVNHLNRDLVDKEFYILSKEYVRKLVQNTHDFKFDDTDVYLRKILKCFTEFQNLHQFQMFLFCSKLVISFIVYFQIILIGLRINMLGVLEVACIAGFIVVNLLVVLFVCGRCELFLREAKETKVLCASLMSIYVEGPLREKAKRMMTILESNPPRFSVYGMWRIEATFLLQTLGIITALMLTQLQFTIL